MKNFEIGERMLKDAEIYYEEMLEAYKKEKWNIVMRRAQEVVELSLKGLLKIMGLEYPKIHDVAPIVIDALKRKGVDMGETFEEIKEISAFLSKERAAAFYGERIYTKDIAEKGKEGAARIYMVSIELFRKLKGEKL